jgi:hypothetical protein
MKDCHEPKNVCTCGFKWSPGRNYLFDEHVDLRHGGVPPDFGLAVLEGLEEVGGADVGQE